MPRIVSLIASATEIACALGFEEQLVGRSHECDYPPAVQALPICTAPNFDVAGSSRDIDERVKSTLRSAASVYRVYADVLRQLKPEVILTQSQCEVCAVSEHDVDAALGDWTHERPRVVSLSADCLTEVWDDIHRVAFALGCPDRAERLVDELKARVGAIAQDARRIAAKPTACCLEWLDPLMAAGNWMPELVELAGGVNLFGQAGKHAPWLSWDEMRQRDPEVIIALPCGYDLDRTRAEMSVLRSEPGWERLRAVRSGRVIATDGNQYFNRPGPRLVESLEILTEVLHPGRFHFGHEGCGWVTYS